MKSTVQWSLLGRGKRPVLDSFIPFSVNHRYTKINRCVKYRDRILGTEGRDFPKRCDDGHLQRSASISAFGLLSHMCIDTLITLNSAVTNGNIRPAFEGNCAIQETGLLCHFNSLKSL